jgi:hypothetical protein
MLRHNWANECHYDVTKRAEEHISPEKMIKESFYIGLNNDSDLFALILNSENLEKEDVCSMCREEFEFPGLKVISLSYKHLYHEKCIKWWFENNSTCPYCMYRYMAFRYVDYVDTFDRKRCGLKRREEVEAPEYSLHLALVKAQAAINKH